MIRSFLIDLGGKSRIHLFHKSNFNFNIGDYEKFKCICPNMLGFDIVNIGFHLFCEASPLMDIIFFRNCCLLILLQLRDGYLWVVENICRASKRGVCIYIFFLINTCILLRYLSHMRVEVLLLNILCCHLHVRISDLFTVLFKFALYNESITSVHWCGDKEL